MLQAVPKGSAIKVEDAVVLMGEHIDDKRAVAMFHALRKERRASAGLLQKIQAGRRSKALKTIRNMADREPAEFYRFIDNDGDPALLRFL